MQRNATTFSAAERDSLRDYLLHSVLQNVNEVGRRDLAHYLNYAFERYIVTLEYLPTSRGSVLELGASPYHLTLLMLRLREYELELTNFHTEEARVEWEHTQIVNEKYGEQHDLRCRHVNVETDRFPYPDGFFDGVLFCELLEHMMNDPVAALREIHRVLKPGGWLLLTTPNINRYENVVRLAAGWNIVDQYSGYGPYGRHNREYSLNEIEGLLQNQGFDIERLDARAMLPPVSGPMLDRLLPLLGPQPFYEDNIFCLARRGNREPSARPHWLYRSYPLDQIDSNATLRDFVGLIGAAPPPASGLREELEQARAQLQSAQEENERHRLVLRTKIVSAALLVQRWLARLRGK